MNRNKNVEAIRGIAILGMLLYHYMLSISGFSLNLTAQILNEALGQISLFTFFVISGFGTYMFLAKQDKKEGKIGTIEYFKKRVLNIYPQYIFCIIFIVFLTPSVQSVNIRNLLEMLLFVQNYNSQNTINGVTWTIAVLVQFYLLAKPIYTLVKKKGIIVWPCAALICIVVKKILIGFVTVHEMSFDWNVMISSRNPFTTIDLFVAGMCSAYMYIKYKEKKINTGMLSISIIVCIVAYFAWFYNFFVTIGLYKNHIASCMAQSLVGFFSAVIIFLCANLNFEYRSIMGKGIQFLAKNEYGIYLWHMILMGNFISYAPGWFVVLNEEMPVLLLLLMLVCGILIGWLSNITASSMEYKSRFFMWKN